MKRLSLILLAFIGVLLIAAVVIGMATMRVEITYEPQTDPDALVQPVRFGHSNIYLISADDGYVLVDAGMPGSEQKLDEVFALTGIDPTEVRLIVATHGHMDHIGVLAHAKQITGAPLAAHASIAEVLKAGEYEDAVAQSWMGSILNTMTAILMATYEIEPVTLDILIENGLDLADFGVQGRIVHTRGHSPSSLSILLDSGEVVIADMVREEPGGQIGPGMFYADKDRLIESLKLVAEESPETIYLSHGDRIDPESFMAAIAGLENS